jgi:hypothetical protein
MLFLIDIARLEEVQRHDQSQIQKMSNSTSLRQYNHHAQLLLCNFS